MTAQCCFLNAHFFQFAERYLQCFDTENAVNYSHISVACAKYREEYHKLLLDASEN